MTALTSKKSQANDKTRVGMRYLALTDPYVLVKHILASDLPPSLNRISETLHKPLCEFMQTTPHRENLYLVSRGHLKSTIITVARNVQRILNNPQVRILIGSNKSENAEGFLQEIQGRLELPIMFWLFPDILVSDPAKNAEEWTKSKLTVKRKRKTKESTVETIGETGEITSRHYDHGTFDDMVGKQNFDTREARQKTKKFLLDVRPLFDPGTSTIDYVGTTWHYDDAYSWLLQQEKDGLRKLGVFRRPCWYPDPNGEDTPYGPMKLWYPEKFTVAELLDIRGQGVSEFAANYLIDPLPADTAYFPREQMLPHIVPRSECPPIEEMWKVMTVDPAISKRGHADYSAIATVGFDRQGLMWILDLRRGRWHEHELIDQIYDAWARTPGIQSIGFETEGFQQIFRSLFVIEGEKRGHFLPVMKLARDTQIKKHTRIRALEPWWAKGEIRILRDVRALEDFLEEAERWRPDRDNAHDDLLDAVVDTIQMRLRPVDEEPASIYDDPDTAERARMEQSIINQRQQAGMPPLDHGELWFQQNHARRRQAMEQDQQMYANSAMGEF